MFVFFNNRLGCLGSAIVSIVATLLLFAACHATHTGFF